jgi:hypothetical protein
MLVGEKCRSSRLASKSVRKRLSRRGMSSFGDFDATVAAFPKSLRGFLRL